MLVGTRYRHVSIKQVRYATQGSRPETFAWAHDPVTIGRLRLVHCNPISDKEVNRQLRGCRVKGLSSIGCSGNGGQSVVVDERMDLVVRDVRLS